MPKAFNPFARKPKPDAVDTELVSDELEQSGDGFEKSEVSNQLAELESDIEIHNPFVNVGTEDNGSGGTKPRKAVLYSGLAQAREKFRFRKSIKRRVDQPVVVASTHEDSKSVEAVSNDTQPPAPTKTGQASDVVSEVEREREKDGNAQSSPANPLRTATRRIDGFQLPLNKLR